VGAFAEGMWGQGDGFGRAEKACFLPEKKIFLEQF